MTDISTSADREVLAQKAGEIFDDVLVNLSRDRAHGGRFSVEVAPAEGADSFFQTPPRGAMGRGDFESAAIDSPQALALEIAAIWRAAGIREFEELADRLNVFANEVPEGIFEELSDISTNVYVMY